MSKTKGCLHTDCIRMADKKCNGYCSKCYQIPDKVCNRCEVVSTIPRRKLNWLRPLNFVLLALCVAMIIHGIIQSIITQNILALGGWGSALLWFGAYLIMKKLSDTSLAIATISLQTVGEILEEIELTDEQAERLKIKLNIK